MRVNYKILFNFILVFCVALSFIGCKNKKSNEIFKYDINADPVSLDPQLANDYASSLVMFNMYEGLLRINSDGKLTEGVAKDYKVSANGLIYTFSLRQDAKWENGENVTAYDFVFAFRRLFDPQTNSAVAKNYYCIKNAKDVHEGKTQSGDLGVRAVDAFTFEIALEYKNSMFLQFLTQPASMPCNEKFFNETKGKYGLDADKTLSNGPFLLNGWAHDDYLSLRRNEEYTSTRTVVPAGVSFIVESEKAQYRFTTGQTDAYIFTGVDKINLNKYAVSEYENTIWGIGFNLNNKVLKHDYIRKALVKGFNPESFSKSLPNYFIGTKAVIPSSITMLDKNYRDYAGGNLLAGFNTGEAKELLEQSKNEIKNLNKLILIAPEGLPHLEMFAYVSQVWQKELGVYIGVKSLPPDEYQKALDKKDFDLAIVSINAEYNSPESVLSAFKTGSQKNYYSYDSAEFNKFIKKANKADNVASAAQNYMLAEKMIINDGVFIPLYYQKQYFAKDKKTKGLLFYPANKMIDFTGGTK